MIIGVSYDALWELPGDYAMNVVIRVNDVQKGAKCRKASQVGIS